MITVDDSKILRDSYNIDGVYHADNHESSRKVKATLLDGIEVKAVYAVDVNKGIVIKLKTDITGQVLFSDCAPIYEVLFGKVEVILHDVEHKTV